MESASIRKRPFSVSGVLKRLGVSRSGFHAFLHHKPAASQQRKDAVKDQIRSAYDASKQIYGAPKITRKLREAGLTISERTVGKYMREMGIKAQWVKPYTVTTRDSDFSEELHNILDEKFHPKRPNAVWCTDITYIWTWDGFVYLTSIMEVSCVIDTIEKAKARRSTDLPLIIHSDRGSQYVSKAYRKATEDMQRSYSHKGYPYDNACIESFHALIKREWLDRFKITDFKHAYRLVFEYIEAFYNTVRIHSHCDYMSPDQYEKLYQKVTAA